ncbi:MAG: hypothetical protein KAU17_11975 [Spirochaetales bacterium]|jgi:hypothetical protein|nr:hypothetical protein [Pseudomonadota bacterium]MCK4542944.1 hypothetical protein [Spirochaetales bacterium]
MPPDKQTMFLPDDETNPMDRNALLAAHLGTTWNNLDIIRIERIEESESGWQATYRI